jgi:two-component sensor histidine kinase
MGATVTSEHPVHWQRRFGVAATPFAAVLLAVVMLAGLAGLASLMIWQSYKSAIEAGEARAMSSAQMVAAHFEWMMEAGEQALRRIDTAVGSEPVGSSSEAVSDIGKAVGDLHDGFQYSVYDETGYLTYSSVPEAVGIQVSDREYFQRLRDGESIVISPQLEERLSGEQVFVIARRISRNGRFHGAASIAIPTRAMDDFWSLLGLGPNSTVSVIRTDGWLVARRPQLPDAIDLSGARLFTEFLPAATDGVYHSRVSPADGLSRIVGFQKVRNWPLVATSGIEREEALQFFWTSLKAGLLVGLPLFGLLVLGIIWIVRLLRADTGRRVALERALEGNRFLMREIHHRVKNNLQAVSSLVRMQPLPPDRKDDLARRIAAMVAVHEQIYGADQFDRVEVAPYVARLVKKVAEGFRGQVRIETDIAALTLSPDQAMPLGLIVNEVVTNAFKHAFSDRANGRLIVSLSVEGKNAQLLVEDDGPGHGTSREKGMGSRLIDGFVGQLGGTVSIDTAHGTKVVVSFPVE